MSASSDASEYKIFEETESHVRAKPDMWIGTVETVERSVYIYQNDKISMKVIKTSEGLEQLFKETISNAADNVVRSREADIDPIRIEAVVNETSVSIKNYGRCITLKKHPKTSIPVPEMIFGSMFTSSNYGETRKGAGTNGLGIKAVNIFSEKFVLEIKNGDEGRSYYQVWTNGKRNKTVPEIKEYRGTSSVTVTYYPDFKECFPSDEKHTDETICLMLKHMVDISANYKIPVIFNGKTYNFSKRENYAMLYLPGDTKNNHASEEIDFSYDTTINKKKVPRDNGNMDVYLVDAPDNGISVSFVNGLYTKDGGTHIDGIVKQIVNDVREKLSDRKQKINVTPSDVKANLAIFVFCFVDNPGFNGQVKSKLTAPAIKVTVSEKIYSKIMKWKFIENLLLIADAKDKKKLKKSDGKNLKRVPLKTVIDANKVTIDSKNCVLCVVEGQSASGYTQTRVELTPKGGDYIGTMRIQGKTLNVTNASVLEISENNEIAALKMALGLREGIDYQYEQNFRTLRYGSLLIVADADDDGKHIIGLLLNFFYNRYPSLLKREFVHFLRTPIIRLYKGQEVIRFYTLNDYDEWEAKTDEKERKKWDIAYFKGLGSSVTKDVKDDMKNERRVICVYDDKTPGSMQLAFDEKYADLRKLWISEFQVTPGLSQLMKMPISTFIEKEMVEFSAYNLQRSIGSAVDGLKIVQRKILWTALNATSNKCISLSVFCGKVKDSTHYRHGDAPIQEAASNMAMNWDTCGNNLPLLYPDGQFGSRYLGGKDCADGRYTKTRLNYCVNKLFIKDDFPIYEENYEDGVKIEPKYLIPILPLILMNGCAGIGTGHSTNIPSHHPLDVAQWFIDKIDGKLPKTIYPWYRGYKGTLEIIKANDDGSQTARLNVNNRKVTVTESKTDDHELLTIYSVKSLGHFYITHNGDVGIDELPIGRWPSVYNLFLRKMVDEGFISDFDDARDGGANFVIKGLTVKPSLTSLRLSKNISITNMTGLDKNFKPKRYKSTNEIMEDFYIIRQDAYRKRLNYQISQIVKKLAFADDKRRFIEGALSGEIKVFKAEKKSLHAKLDELKIVHEVVKKTSAYEFTQEGLQTVTDSIKKLKDEKEALESTNILKLWKDEILAFVKEYEKYYPEVEYKLEEGIKLSKNKKKNIYDSDSDDE